jgi:DNA-binding transcriptional regulator PaaX
LEFYVNEPATEEQIEVLKIQKYDDAIREILADGKEMGVNAIRKAYIDAGHKGERAVPTHLENGRKAGWLIMEKIGREHLYRLADDEAQIV